MTWLKQARVLASAEKQKEIDDRMKASKGMKSVESYREAVKYQEEVNKNYPVG